MWRHAPPTPSSLFIFLFLFTTKDGDRLYRKKPPNPHPRHHRLYLNPSRLRSLSLSISLYPPPSLRTIELWWWQRNVGRRNVSVLGQFQQLNQSGMFGKNESPLYLQATVKAVISIIIKIRYMSTFGGSLTNTHAHTHTQTSLNWTPEDRMLYLANRK